MKRCPSGSRPTSPDLEQCIWKERRRGELCERNLSMPMSQEMKIGNEIGNEDARERPAMWSRDMTGLVT